MANSEICVFCGEKPGTFRSTTVQCGNTWQYACKACEKELDGLNDLERCRRALLRGLAEQPDRLRERIDLITESENHRLKCLRCGSGLIFMEEQSLDNSPMGDSIFHGSFDVLPAYCESCGKFEFYNPAVIQKDKYLRYLAKKDTQE